jgi:hypothetical protein
MAEVSASVDCYFFDSFAQHAPVGKLYQTPIKVNLDENEIPLELYAVSKFLGYLEME